MAAFHVLLVGHEPRTRQPKPFGLRSGAKVSTERRRLLRGAVTNRRPGQYASRLDNVSAVRFGFVMLGLGVLLLSLSCLLGM